MRISRVETERCGLGEGPLWDVGEQALYFLDVLGRKVHRHDPLSGATRSWTTPAPVSAMALRQSGGAVIAMEAGLFTLDFASGATVALAAPSLSQAHFNDGKVDRRGRFVTGTKTLVYADPAPVGSIYSLGADHALTRLDDDIILSNGPSWSPDGRTFHFVDSFRRSILAYDYDLETGVVANRRVFAETEALGGVPDGTTVDSDGLLWAAICQGGKIAAFTPDGKVERVIDMPSRYTSSVMFGGPDLDRLYVTTLGPELLGAAASEADGHLYVIDGLGVRGLPEPRYAG